MNRTDYSQRSRVRNGPLTTQEDAARYYSTNAISRATPTRAAKEAWAHAFPHPNGRPVSLSYVEKWRIASGGLMDTGRRNPADRFYAAIADSVATGVPFWDAIAPLQWVARRLGLRLTARGGAVEVDPHQVAADIARHSGELAAYIVESMADGVLDIDERRGIHERIERCIRAYIGAEAMAEVYTA